MNRYYEPFNVYEPLFLFMNLFKTGSGFMNRFI